MPQSILRSHTLRTIALQTDRDKRTVQRWYEKACSDCRDEVGEVTDGTRYFSDDERDMMLAHMGEKPSPIEAEQTPITVEVGNHAITLAAPQLPTTYSLESLRSSDVIAFDDPLAIAAQFLEAADLVTSQMQQDLQARQAAIARTQQAKEAIDQKALELKIQSKLYREQTAMANAVHSAETQGLQQSLNALQTLGKPTEEA